MESPRRRSTFKTQRPGKSATFSVRVARASDRQAMVGLLGDLFAQEADFTPAPVKQRRALDAILSNPEVGQIFVVGQGKEVLGMVSLLLTISTAEGGKVAWLEDMVVRPDHRGSGLGSLLLGAALAWARKRGLRRITLLTDVANLHARRFYERHGFSLTSMHPLRLSLGRNAKENMRTEFAP